MFFSLCVTPRRLRENKKLNIKDKSFTPSSLAQTSSFASSSPS